MASLASVAPGDATLLRAQRNPDELSSIWNMLLREAWERRPLVLRGPLADPERLLSLADFEALLLAGPGSGVPVSVIADGVARPLEVSRAGDRLAAALKFYARGASLLGIGLQALRPAIAALCRDLDLAVIEAGIPLAQATAANAYLTPPSSRGLPLHYDNHCAVVLQLVGAKQWSVFAPGAPLPTARCVDPIAADTLGPPLMALTLSAGDLLYIPRGHPHAARCGDRSSLHLTLSVSTVTWGSLFDRADDAAPVWRRSACEHDDGGGDGADLPEAAERRDRIARRIARSVAGLAPVAADRIAAVDAARGLPPHAPLTRAPRTLLRARVDDGVARLHYPGGLVELPRAMAPVFAFIADAERFTAADLPDVGADYDRSELVRLLVQRGILAPAAVGAEA